MDCGEFRRAKLAVPRDAPAGALEHERACAPCAAFAREIDTLEDGIHRVARVAVPDGLAERIIVEQRKAGRFGRVARWLRRIGGGPLWFGPVLGAAAATAIIVLGALLAFNFARPDPLARVIIAHVASEPEFERVRGNVEDDAVARVFSRYGGRLEGTLGQVHRLGNCVIDGVVVQHLWVQTFAGDAALILVPGDATRTRPHTQGEYTAIVLPLKGGSVGIVTRSRDSALKVHELVARRVRLES
jgi:hypothetical protein